MFNMVHAMNDATRAAYLQVEDFAIEACDNIEVVVVMTAASIGTASVMGQVPMKVDVPLPIEKKMIIPVLGVLAVVGAVKLSEFREKHGFTIRRGKGGNA